MSFSVVQNVRDHLTELIWEVWNWCCLVLNILCIVLLQLLLKLLLVAVLSLLQFMLNSPLLLSVSWYKSPPHPLGRHRSCHNPWCRPESVCGLKTISKSLARLVSPHFHSFLLCRLFSPWVCIQGADVLDCDRCVQGSVELTAVF